MSADQWYYEVNGQGYGPISGRELKQLADGELIQRTTLVRQGERGQWARADKYRGLFADPAEAEPPPVVKQPLPRIPAAPAQPPPAAPAVQRPVQPAPQFVAPPPQRPVVQTVPEAQFVSFDGSSQIVPGAHPKVSIAGAANRTAPKAATPKPARGGKYESLIFVSKLYNVLAWIVLVVGALGIAAYLALAIVGAVGSGEAGAAAVALAISFGGAVLSALYVLLTFVTLRGASQAIILAMDVERNTSRSNELLENIRDSLASRSDGS